ncbi:EAP20 [Mytilus edulis]|uniref:Vacuolar protein-sorting-associated protein 25 n=1 Tax=Mytilus edulis TaxID=6550 RepID=A0A8S3PSL7_MYTED|nr:EAP20 [Mytilus edulis]
MEWPWQYNFPPFFTIQPNSDTRKKQLEAWCSLILNYHKQKKSYSIDVTEILNSQLCHNKEIDRKLSLDGLYTVLDELCRTGHLEWKDPKTKKQCLIISKSMTNTVCTFYELTNGEESEGTEFHGLEKWLLLRAIKTLEAQRKAEIMMFDDSEGVKFF